MPAWRGHFWTLDLSSPTFSALVTAGADLDGTILETGSLDLPGFMNVLGGIDVMIGSSLTGAALMIDGFDVFEGSGVLSRRQRVEARAGRLGRSDGLSVGWAGKQVGACAHPKVCGTKKLRTQMPNRRAQGL